MIDDKVSYIQEQLGRQGHDWVCVEGCEGICKQRFGLNSIYDPL